MIFSSMPLGQYVPVKSKIHSLDPRAKLLLLVTVLFAVFPSKEPLSLACCAVGLAAVIRLSHLPFKMILRSSRPIVFLAVFTFLFNIVAGVMGGAGRSRAVYLGVIASVRLLLMFFFSVMLPLTTAPLELADGLERLLSPLKRLGFPVSECAMMIGIALRFIPLLMEETDRIVKAQLSRGAQLDQGNIFKRIAAFFPVLVPLFVIVFRRADELALAMEARGYNGGVGRTRRNPLRWKKNDTRATILVVCVVIVFIFAKNLRV